MSTKCSYMYGNDYHFYFDYKDMGYHLEVKGKKVKLPREMVLEMVSLVGLRNNMMQIIHACEKERKKMIGD